MRRAALVALLVAAAAPAAASDTVDRRCYRNDAFTVLVRPNDNGWVGSTLTVRKSTATFRTDCIFEQRATDTVIGGEDPYSYVALRRWYLILDEGAGPDSAVIVIDARTGKPILEADYVVVGSNPMDGGMSDEFRYDDSSLTFWRATRAPVTARNCPDMRKWAESGLVPVMLEKTVFHFATAKAETLAARRCSPMQVGPWKGYRIKGVPQK